MSDGGEGLLEVTGGPNRWTVVTGPLGDPVTAAWRLDEPGAGHGAGGGAGHGSLRGAGHGSLRAAGHGDRRGAGTTAVIEMSQAAGLVLAGGPETNDPVAATTTGVGELIVTALAEGAARIVVGCGGSASTDGGAGALAVIGGPERLVGVQVVVACGVTVGFLEAAR
jgi:glycerate 2-kinase